MRAKGFMAGAAALMALSGCGLADAMTLGGGEPATDAQIAQLDSQVNGTVQERRAYLYLRYVAEQSRKVSCVHQAGGEYHPSPFEDPWGGMERSPLPAPYPAAGSTSIARARAEGLGAEAQARHRYARGHTELGPAKPNRKVPASCGDNGAKSWHEEIPPFARPLFPQLDQVWVSAAKNAGVTRRDEAYADCLRGKGVPLPRTDEVQVALQVAADQLYADKDLKPDTPAWEAARQKEIRMAVADAECRADDHARYLETLGPIMADFEKAHASEIARVDKQWGELPAQAERAQAAFRKAHPTAAPAVDFTG